jgi:hypothetical protein
MRFIKNIFTKINNFLNSSVFILPAAFVYIIINFIFVILLYLYRTDLWLEIIKWLQFFALAILLSFYLNKLNKYLSFIIVYLVNFAYLILIAFFLITNTKLDISFLKRNIRDINIILPQYIYYILILAFIAFLNALFIHKIKKHWAGKYKILSLSLLVLFVLATIFFRGSKFNNEFVVFAKTIYRDDETINYYQDFYARLIQKLTEEKKIVKEASEKIYQSERPDYLDNIVIFHLESLNGFLVNEKNTPVFTAIAKEGIFFPKFYANSVQTVLGYESMLCSMPSSFDANLVYNKNLDQIICLPNFLKNFGYKNYFFKGGNELASTKLDEFIPAIGFDELHNKDIMQAGDPKYPWGYREDIFYQRVFEYLNKNLAPKNNFLYIDVAGTNHWPFKTPAGFEAAVPFPDPKNHQERLINTTWLQDSYLKIAWDYLNELFPEKNYTLLILGDHSWPAEIHPQNTFNERNGYEENFMDSMVMIIGDEYKNKIISEKYNQMDILPSIVDLFGIKYPENEWRMSFIGNLNGQDGQPNKTIQIQPFADKIINIINGHDKYQYDGETNQVFLCDLIADPLENNCKILSDNKKNNLYIVKNLLNDDK